MRDSLVGLGFKRSEATAACDEAIAHVGTASLERVIREALRRCPKPGGCYTVVPAVAHEVATG